MAYACAEQYMMAEKAKLFGDEDVWRQVMATDDPRYAVRTVHAAVIVSLYQTVLSDFFQWTCDAWMAALHT